LNLKDFAIEFVLVNVFQLLERGLKLDIIQNPITKFEILLTILAPTSPEIVP